MKEVQVQVRRHIRRRESHTRRWYHGSSAIGAQAIRSEGVIRPGMPTKFRQDIPRSDAVYVTDDKRLAESYAVGGGKVFEVRVDESKLIPDEDLLFEILDNRNSKMYDRVLEAWRKYNYGVYGDRKALTKKEAEHRFEFIAEATMEDPFSTMLAEEMKNFVEWVMEHNPELADALIKHGKTAAHLGPVKVLYRRRR